MTYLRYIPSPPLNTYINALYYLEGPMPHARTKIVPLPCLDLKINFGDALQMGEAGYPERNATLTESWCVGLWNECHRVGWPPDMQLLGVNFKPGGAAAFFSLPLYELRNEVVALDTLWGQFAVEIRERLYAATSIQARFALLEQLLLARLRATPHGFATVHYATAKLARHHGTMSVRALSDDIGISQNHLVTLFKRMVGALPKEMARLHRFEHALLSIDPGQGADWARIAHDSGYYDQAHFYKEFGAFTGCTPTDYLRLWREACAGHPDQRRLYRTIPID